MDMPAVRYARAADGARLAYVVFGSGPEMLLTPHGSLAMQYELDEGGPYFEALAQRFRVVLFDRRGMGLSEHEVAA